MPSSHQIIAAHDDPALRRRAEALAVTIGLPPSAVAPNWAALVAQGIAVNGQDTTLADVYGYAAAARAEQLAALPPEPGDNPAAVTDQHLLAALNTLLPDSDEQPTP